jgi:ChaC-like protein
MRSKISLATQISYCIILTIFCAGHNRKPLLFPRQFKNHLPVSTVNIFSLQAHDMNQWDAENGVWLGDMATSDDVLPSPLYMFGYGSLLWRPGDLLCDFPSYSCVCAGWQRIFAQRSSDHRGSPEFPGFVATLVEASYLDSVNRELTSRKTLGGKSSTTTSLVFQKILRNYIN